NTFDANDAKNVLSDDLKFETYWQKDYTTKQMILDLKDAGFKTIRIPVSWHNHVDDGFNINEKWMDRVYEVVNWALEEDMYVILNIHHDNLKKYMYPSYDCLDNSKKYVTKVWEQIATKFGDCGDHLVFESLNEPRLVGTDIEWNIPDLNSSQAKEALDCVNQLNQVIVDTIRQTPGAYNKTRYITVPGYCASPDYILCDGFTVPTDTYADAENRILLTVHAYRPYTFALAEPGQGDTATFDTSNATSELNTLFMNLFVKYIKNGTGILIDEFGARDRNGNTAERAKYAATFTAYANSYLMPVCWWDNNNFGPSGEIFGIYRRSQNRIEYPDIVTQLTYYGNK
ncbi:MAG: glycoside hydrolase family 5 protein, partial [Lachnospiraceae bacterium]|nr:glycoside hydrolase family 5 protein [Lachnospiraceae bacterium]